MHTYFKIDPALRTLATKAEARCASCFSWVDKSAEHNTAKVLAAFHNHQVSETHFVGSTGYGYGDRGRDTLEQAFAEITGSEDAIIRHNFVSGTHALTTALFGVLRTGDRMVSLTGRPYDTLHEVVGLRGEGKGSLKDFGILYEEVPLLGSGRPDLDAIPEAVKGARVAYIQRSRGYSLRPSLTVEDISRLARLVRTHNPGAIVMVDNCYGEFVEEREPTDAGADLIVGSLIKNPGGGIARTGGYIAGRKDLVELCGYRLTSPGTGKEVGCSLDSTREMYLGLFHAPNVVASALKTAAFAASLFDLLGFSVSPTFDEYRTDIIQSMRLGSAESLVAFCQGIQKGAPVDAHVTPEPWDMPGYDSQVIMAAGAFTLGASIELSADAPMREPYAVWMQGGLTYPSGKIGVLLAAQSMLEAGLLNKNRLPV